MEELKLLHDGYIFFTAARKMSSSSRVLIWGLIVQVRPRSGHGTNCSRKPAQTSQLSQSLHSLDCERTRHYQSLAVPLLHQHAASFSSLHTLHKPPNPPTSEPCLLTSCRSVTRRRPLHFFLLINLSCTLFCYSSHVHTLLPPPPPAYAKC